MRVYVIVDTANGMAFDSGFTHKNDAEQFIDTMLSKWKDQNTADNARPDFQIFKVNVKS